MKILQIVDFGLRDGRQHGDDHSQRIRSGPAIVAIVARAHLAQPEDAEVVAEARIHLVLAGPTVDDVVSHRAGDLVVAFVAVDGGCHVGDVDDVIAGPAKDHTAAGDLIVSPAARERVIALVVGDGVVPRASIDIIIAGAARQRIIARTALDGVVPGPAAQKVAAAVPFQDVIAETADEVVDTRTTRHPVVADRAVDLLDADECVRKRGAYATITKSYSDIGHAIVPISIGGQGDPAAAEVRIVQGERIGLIRCQIEALTAVDEVVADAPREGVVPAPTLHAVIARAAVQEVVETVTDQPVIAAVAEKPVA